MVRGVASRMRGQVARLEDLATGVQGCVDETVHLWSGADAHGFSNAWAATTGSLCRTAAWQQPRVSSNVCLSAADPAHGTGAVGSAGLVERR